jgi:hypothetical protein
MARTPYGAWQHLEQPGQRRVDALGDVAVAGQQLVAAGEEELRVVVGEGDEVGERAGEADLVHHVGDAALDARHLGQAGLVHAGRVDVQRGLLAHGQAVDLGAVGIAAHRAVLGADRQQLVDHQLAQLQQGREHLVLQHLRRLVLQRRPAVLGQVDRQLRERREQRVVRHGAREQAVDLRGHQLQRGLERDPAQALALAGPGDVLGDARRHRAQARQRVARVGLGAHGEVAHVRRQLQLQAVHAGDHAGAQDRVVLPVDGQLGLDQRDVVRDAVLAGQHRHVDLLQRLEEVALVRVALVDGLRRRVGQAVVEAMVAERGGVFGELLHAPFPVAVQQGLEARGLQRGVEAFRVAGRGGERGGGRDGGGGQGGGQREQQDGGGAGGQRAAKRGGMVHGVGQE